MSVSIQEFRRRDREQLTALVNLHVASVLPGVALSTNVVLSQLEREPGELVVDPWIEERCCFVAIENAAVVGAALLYRFSNGDHVKDGYRSAVEIKWIIVSPTAIHAGERLLDAVLQRARMWEPSHVYADGSLPVLGCFGIPDSWPHIRQLLTNAGFQGPERTDVVLGARCVDLQQPALEGVEVLRTVGHLGARFDLVADGETLGYVEVGEIDQALARSSAGVVWTDVGNLFAADPTKLPTVMPALLAAAADWLLLGGVDRIIDYYTADVHEPEYLAVLHRLGFTKLSVNERGWRLDL